MERNLGERVLEMVPEDLRQAFNKAISGKTEEELSQLKRALAISNGEGGTMLHVLSLKLRGLSRSQIVETGISPNAVASSERHLRRWGLITESSHARAKRLESELRNPPKDPEVRKALIDAVSPAFYRANPGYFFNLNASARRLVGGIINAENRDQVNTFLRDSGYAVRQFRLDRYIFIGGLRVEKSAVIKFLRNTPMLTRVA